MSRGGRKRRVGGPSRPWRVRSLLPVVAVAAALGAGPSAPVQAQDGSDGSRGSVADFAWLQGSWQGPGPRGATAEIHFMEPSAGVLAAAFRLEQDGRVVVLEFLTVVEEEDGLHMYVRHFSPALVPMEKERAIHLRLEDRSGDRFVFDNVREGNPTVSVLSREGPDRFVSTSELARPDGTADTIRVEYRRTTEPPTP